MMSFITFSLILLSFQRKVALENIRVDIRYLSSCNYDYLDVHTDNVSICTEFNAVYVSRTINPSTFVTCRCGWKQSFFGLNGKQPKCQNENYGKLFGMIINSLRA